MKPDELVTSPEAGRILGKSTRTVHRMVESGELRPALTAPGGPHGAFLFKRADIEALLNIEPRPRRRRSAA